MSDLWIFDFSILLSITFIGFRLSQIVHLQTFMLESRPVFSSPSVKGSGTSSWNRSFIWGVKKITKPIRKPMYVHTSYSAYTKHRRHTTKWTDRNDGLPWSEIGRRHLRVGVTVTRTVRMWTSLKHQRQHHITAYNVSATWKSVGQHNTFWLAYLLHWQGYCTVRLVAFLQPTIRVWGLLSRIWCVPTNFPCRYFFVNRYKKSSMRIFARCGHFLFLNRSKLGSRYFAEIYHHSTSFLHNLSPWTRPPSKKSGKKKRKKKRRERLLQP